MDQTADTETPPESVHQRGLREARERRMKAWLYRNDKDPMTFKEIGEKLGVSAERARQMVNQARAEIG